ncbi:UBN2 domain-containing protein [Gossypium australe]|uniref:UBN2 domain-containing protein n=1 Tax=Gossypium australe TaxID=47621 RepID=A0A5B6WSB8_9ROSI|nr:UBN2 domain-containing protein [Gossypium australe]
MGILTFNYETFMMKPNEDIKDMSDKFTIIINKLKSYGKTYPNEELVKKMLKSLPISWDAKVTTIEEANNLETLSLDKLNEENSERRNDSRLNLPRRRTPSYAMNARSRDTSSLIIFNERKEGQADKNSRLLLLLRVVKIHMTMKIKK